MATPHPKIPSKLQTHGHSEGEINGHRLCSTVPAPCVTVDSACGSYLSKREDSAFGSIEGVVPHDDGQSRPALGGPSPYVFVAGQASAKSSDAISPQPALTGHGACPVGMAVSRRQPLANRLVRDSSSPYQGSAAKAGATCLQTKWHSAEGLLEQQAQIRLFTTSSLNRASQSWSISLVFPQAAPDETRSSERRSSQREACQNVGPCQ